MPPKSCVLPGGEVAYVALANTDSQDHFASFSTPHGLLSSKLGHAAISMQLSARRFRCTSSMTSLSIDPFRQSRQNLLNPDLDFFPRVSFPVPSDTEFS